MGMTWRVRIRGLVIVVASLAALAIASGADYVEFVNWFSW
jgi:hypothetical protein